jgi:hypothetical protein
VVDKDRNPKWSPASLAAVDADDVEAFFAPVDDDLTFQERITPMGVRHAGHGSPAAGFGERS